MESVATVKVPGIKNASNKMIASLYKCSAQDELFRVAYITVLGSGQQEESTSIFHKKSQPYITTSRM